MASECGFDNIKVPINILAQVKIFFHIIVESYSLWSIPIIACPTGCPYPTTADNCKYASVDLGDPKNTWLLKKYSL